MILLGVRQLGSLANQLCADTPDDLLFASVISLQLAFGSASRSVELPLEIFHLGHVGQLVTRHRPTP
jgi:hypothetical protein